MTINYSWGQTKVIRLPISWTTFLFCKKINSDSVSGIRGYGGYNFGAKWRLGRPKTCIGGYGSGRVDCIQVQGCLGFPWQVRVYSVETLKSWEIKYTRQPKSAKKFKKISELETARLRRSSPVRQRERKSPPSDTAAARLIFYITKSSMCKLCL